MKMIRINLTMFLLIFDLEFPFCNSRNSYAPPTSGADRDPSEHRMGDLRFGGASEQRRQREGEEPARCRAHRSSAIYHTAGYSPPLDQQHLLLVARNGPLSGRAPAAIVAPVARERATAVRAARLWCENATELTRQ